MERKHFTQVEAEAEIGKRIRTNVNLSCVPKGSTGRVVRADYAGDVNTANGVVEEWDTVIEWGLIASHQKPLQDWFRKDEYEQFLEQVKEEV